MNLLRQVSGRLSINHCVAPFQQRAGFCGSSILFGKIIPYNLADIGEGILNVEILAVYIKVGDTISSFDKICEVQSDKATVEITSRFDGVVKKLYIEKGVIAHVGKPILDIEVDEGETSVIIPTDDAPKSTAQTTAHPSFEGAERYDATNSKVLAAPATRRIAKENGVDLRNIPGTGKGGRVMKEDIMAFIERSETLKPSSSATGGSSHIIIDRVVPITGVRKAMVKSMTEANKIPSFGACDEIEVSLLTSVREQLKPIFKKRSDGKVTLSYMPFFLKAASIALNQYPEINAFTNEDCTEFTIKGSHNIGFAMDTPNGLIVPNVKNVQDKSLYEIAEAMCAIIENGKKGKVSQSDLQNGTFTLSNIGSIGGTYMNPVVFPPQVAIGALGKLQKLPRFDSNENVVAANLINISWSADHRIVDGATMVRFSNLFKELLECPSLMLVDLK
eukprot:Tbor_TRINITY_DN4008_c0_g2::TRINITY_DN4008_c0_g2_i1::g.11781::m.11781/K09699/DBT, bkdB; 2-oxoisovalerate dehydrogenase E2 component (dihydrolipoyl transacylase)